MKYIVISGDVLSSTSLTTADRNVLKDSLQNLLDILSEKSNIYGRIIKGDYLECVVPNSSDGLRIALAIKCFVKTIPLKGEYTADKNRVMLFKTYGIRLALGYGELQQFDPKEGLVDGEAIYLSGRAISGASTHDKERVVIKNTLFFDSADIELNKNFEALFGLLDVLLAKATARQCEVLFQKLMFNNEETIASKLKINQSVVNQHSTSSGWNAIENAVSYFNHLLKNK